MAFRPIYYDTETTGTRPDKDRIIEIAAFDPELGRTFCSFINPGCPIPPEATAISHITDEMVQGAPPLREVLASFTEFCSKELNAQPPSDLILIAHNNDAFDLPFLRREFEQAQLTMPPWTFLDTLKWSRKYRSDLPRHNLQSLREAYGIEANQAHRALDDVLVLHQVFSKMVGDLPWKTILELLAQSPKVIRMPFGKHTGKPLSELPRDYVAWLAKSGALDKRENAQLKETFQKLGMLVGVP